MRKEYILGLMVIGLIALGIVLSNLARRLDKETHPSLVDSLQRNAGDISSIKDTIYFDHFTATNDTVRFYDQKDSVVREFVHCVCPGPGEVLVGKGSIIGDSNLVKLKE